MFWLLVIVLPLVAIAVASAGWLEARAARKAGERAEKELRAIRLQGSNTIELLQAAGFKKKRVGWEDDFHATQARESAPEISWWGKKP